MKKKALFFVLLAGVLLIKTSPSAALGDITPVLTILLLDDNQDGDGDGFAVVTLNDLLVRPWGLAFLPDNRMLVTEKGGRMVILSADGTIVQEIVNELPIVAGSGQGGLLDVALDPDFTNDPWVYWTYAEPGTGVEEGLAGTAVARGRLVDNTLQDVEVIYRQVPKRGFTNARFRTDYTILNVGLLEAFDDGATVDLDAIRNFRRAPER